ncbi:hypothetical protein AKO1_004811 [Acrasis kona]|uniref:Uncharacterized protein n=1 Tax=Acrasis kona TaxID=1008807 RepID=A0AAW2Z5N4_9EUKA
MSTSMEHLKNVIIPETLEFMSDKTSKPLRTVLFPIPDKDFDPTETAFAWSILKKYGYECHFATEDGNVGVTDLAILNNEGLSFAAKTMFSMLGLTAKEDFVQKAYEDLTKDEHFLHPLSWKTVDVKNYDGLYCSGGHAWGVKQYLGSEELQRKVSEFWSLDRPVAAICHGVLLVARSKLLNDQSKSVLTGKRVTCLTNFQEWTAYYATGLMVGNMFRTYEETTQDEVTRLMYNAPNKEEATKQDQIQKLFDVGPPAYKKIWQIQEQFVVEDGNFLSARWPGDTMLIAHRFAQKLAMYNKNQ